MDCSKGTWETNKMEPEEMGRYLVSYHFTIAPAVCAVAVFEYNMFCKGWSLRGAPIERETISELGFTMDGWMNLPEPAPRRVVAIEEEGKNDV